MAQQGRVRRSSMELNSVPASLYQEGISYSNSFKQDPLSLLLGHDAAAAGPGTNGLAMNGVSPMTIGILEQPQLTEPMCVPVTNGYDSMQLEAEEPGPLPCLPRAGRLGAGYGNSAALLMQQQQLQQLQRCGYPNSGAPGPGGRALRPRRHSVTIGMLNEHQQQQVLLAAAGQMPAGWAGGVSSGTAGAAGPVHMPMLSQQCSPSKQLQGLHMQAVAAAAQLGMSKSALGQAYVAGSPGTASPCLQMQAQLGAGVGQSGGCLAGSGGMGGANAVGPLYGASELPPAYAIHAPRLPGGGSNRRHSWAPMSADASMAYARNWLVQQQQQRGLTAQLGDAGALFVNHQQQEHLGLGGFGGSLGPRSCLEPGSADHSGSFAGLQNQASLTMSMAQTSAGLPMYGPDALAKDQVTQHLQQQLQQLQLQDLANRMGGTGQALDPYAEPFISQPSLLQPAAGLAGALAGMDPYTTALHQELQQQQQSALALQFVDDAGLSSAAAAAAASMYAPLQVNGVSVDTQLLVSPYVDNWDVLTQGAASGAFGGGCNAAGAGTGMSALAVLSAQPTLGHMGVAGRTAKPTVSSAGSSGSGSSRLNQSSSASTPSSSNSGTKGHNAAPAAAAAAAATMLASLPPLTKVCSDAPWNLKKAADEDAKAIAAQQLEVKKLTAALECSKTLQRVHAAEAAATGASTACAATSCGACSTYEQPNAVGDGSAALFGYKLPDSGDDTWGGSSSGVEAVAVPGGNCISREPSNKLFVGNIGWWVTEEDLLHWFSRFGTVTNVKIMYNSRKMHKPKDKWRSREYGFIDYASPEEAARAIVWMDGVELPDLMKDTCGIIVQYAKPTGSTEASTGPKDM